MVTLGYLEDEDGGFRISCEDGDLRDIWKGKMVVIGAGETLWVRVGSCVLSRRSQTSTLPSFLAM